VKLNDDNKETLTTAIGDVLKHSAHVVLITQPPALPYGATRRAFRQNGVHSIVEDPAAATHRQAINDFIRSLQAHRIHVIEVDPLFITRGGEIKFCDEHGRQLYQDRGHLSGYGADLVRQPLAEKLRVLLGERKPRDTSQPVILSSAAR
jgi:hypothetical protein